MVIVTRNNIDILINKEILYVGIIYIYTKYQYVLHSCLFLFLRIVVLLTPPYLFNIKVTWLPHVSNSIKTFSNLTNYYSSMEGDHIRSNHSLVRKSDCP